MLPAQYCAGRGPVALTVELGGNRPHGLLAHQDLGGLCQAWASSEVAMGRSHGVSRKLSSAINGQTRDTVLEFML